MSNCIHSFIYITLLIVFISAEGKQFGKHLNNPTESFPLHEAVENMANPEFLRKLVRSGVGINLQDKQGKTALHHAAQAGNAFAAQELVMNGADASVLNQEGNSALDVAYNEYQKLSQTGQDKSLKRLLKKLPAKEEGIQPLLKQQALDRYKRTMSILFKASER